MGKNKKQIIKDQQLMEKKLPKRPFTKNDFETVLKAVTKPLKKKSIGKVSGKT